MKKQESKHNRLYISLQKVEIDPLLGKIKKYYASWFYQLTIGYKAIGIFFKKIRRKKSTKYL